MTRVEAEEGLDQLDDWNGNSLTIHPVVPNLLRAGARVAMAVGHPIQDCIYLALADQLGCPLATCDVKFRDRVGDPTRVKLLAELV